MRVQIRLPHFPRYIWWSRTVTITSNLVLSHFVKSGIVNQYGGSPPPHPRSSADHRAQRYHNHILFGCPVGSSALPCFLPRVLIRWLFPAPLKLPIKNPASCVHRAYKHTCMSTLLFSRLPQAQHPRELDMSSSHPLTREDFNMAEQVVSE